MKNLFTNNIRRPRKLYLGQDYIMSWPYKKYMLCRFIQPTNKGYNFLNLETNKCILPRHLYPSKKFPENFWVNSLLSIDIYNPDNPVHICVHNNITP